MKLGWTFGLAAVVALSIVTVSLAQGGQLTANVNYTGTIDCDQPKQVKDLPISGRGVARMSQDKRASLDMYTQGFTSSHTRFEAMLGGTPAAAPGGTASLRMVSSSQLRLWDLPNHLMIVNVRMTRPERRPPPWRECNQSLSWPRLLGSMHHGSRPDFRTERLDCRQRRTSKIVSKFERCAYAFF